MGESLTEQCRVEEEGPRTAGDKPEEGEDHVKSSCPLCPGRLTCYNGRDKGRDHARDPAREDRWGDSGEIQCRSNFLFTRGTRAVRGGPPWILSSRESIHPLSVYEQLSLEHSHYECPPPIVQRDVPIYLSLDSNGSRFEKGS
ncbi:hypothetical protein LUZ61_023135 [Rhynchospora tenuis]|uniref:Uncharacterized protein ycf68 n=1 Tax=Rhynchospora tenuis TaxID=198213 RepID=A0AAD5W7F7_9POAL|nr:hypothetical protein LUZ61_023135 [Rhynchospora tenuis]